MLAGAYELSRGGVREASCNLSFFPGSVWGSSRPGRFWATGDGSSRGFTGQLAAESIANLKSGPGTGRGTGQAYRPAKRYRILGRRRAFACGTERGTRNATLLAGARGWLF